CTTHLPERPLRWRGQPKHTTTGLFSSSALLVSAGVHDALQVVATTQRQLLRHPKHWERGANMKVPAVAGMQQARAPAQRAALHCKEKNPTSRRGCWVGGGAFLRNQAP